MKHGDVSDEAKLIRVAPIETNYCMNNWSGHVWFNGRSHEASGIEISIGLYQEPIIHSPGSKLHDPDGGGV